MIYSLTLLYAVLFTFSVANDINTPCEVIDANRVVGELDRTAYDIFAESEYDKTCTIEKYNIDDKKESSVKYKMVLNGGLKNGTIRLSGKLQDDKPATIILSRTENKNNEQYSLAINKTTVTVKMISRYPYGDSIKCETNETFTVIFLVQVKGLLARINKLCELRAPLPPNSELNGEFIILFTGPTVYNYMDYGFLLPYSNWDKTDYDEISLWFRGVRTTKDFSINIQYKFSDGDAMLSLFPHNRQAMLYIYYMNKSIETPEDVIGECKMMGKGKQSMILKTSFMAKGEYPVQFSVNDELCMQRNESYDLHHLRRVTILAGVDAYNLTYLRGILYSSSKYPARHKSDELMVGETTPPPPSNTETEEKQWHLGMEEPNISHHLLITAIVAVVIIIAVI